MASSFSISINYCKFSVPNSEKAISDMPLHAQVRNTKAWKQLEMASPESLGVISWSKTRSDVRSTKSDPKKSSLKASHNWIWS